MNQTRSQQQSAAFFAVVWGLMSLVTWGILCLAALTFKYSLLKAGLVPAGVLLALAVIPVAVVTLCVQVCLYLTAVKFRGDKAYDMRLWLVIGTPTLTLILLALMILLAGGPEAFVPRL
jgi:hypothetical protein